MMKNVKSPKVTQLKALLIVPLLAGLLMAFAKPPLISQTGNKDLIITGNVSDRFTGSPVIGANLIIKGTTTGTITDLKGNYKIIVNNSDDKLIISFTGYRTQELSVGKNSVINIQLEPDIVAIDFSKGNSFIPAEKPANLNESKQTNKNDGKSNSEESFVFVEEMPSYPGGTDALNEFIQKNLTYPEEARKAGLEGTVIVTYIIDVNGKVTNPKVIRGIQLDMDKEALRVTNLIKGWKPASQGGRPVSTTVTMPVEFKLN